MCYVKKEERVDLATLLDETKRGGEKLREAQKRGREACVRAVRKLESSLVEALDGEKLRELPVLMAFEDGEKIHAARVRGKSIDGMLREKPMLVIADDGSLQLAWIEPANKPGARAIRTRAVEDSELLVEDVEDVARAVEEVLRRNLASLLHRTERFERLESLAKRLEGALAR